MAIRHGYKSKTYIPCHVLTVGNPPHAPHNLYQPVETEHNEDYAMNRQSMMNSEWQWNCETLVCRYDDGTEIVYLPDTGQVRYFYGHVQDPVAVSSLMTETHPDGVKSYSDCSHLAPG